MNEKYIELRDSMDGLHFSGNVCVVADSIGSIMLHDLLCSPDFNNKQVSFKLPTTWSKSDLLCLIYQSERLIAVGMTK